MALVLSYAFTQVIHNTAPNAVPHEVMHQK